MTWTAYDQGRRDIACSLVLVAIAIFLMVFAFAFSHAFGSLFCISLIVLGSAVCAVASVFGSRGGDLLAGNHSIFSSTASLSYVIHIVFTISLILCLPLVLVPVLTAWQAHRVLFREKGPLFLPFPKAEPGQQSRIIARALVASRWSFILTVGSILLCVIGFGALWVLDDWIGFDLRRGVGELLVALLLITSWTAGMVLSLFSLRILDDRFGRHLAMAIPGLIFGFLILFAGATFLSIACVMLYEDIFISAG